MVGMGRSALSNARPRAGLTRELLSAGRVVTAHGHRSAKSGERLMKAERVVIDGKSYNLYPDRPS
jgi:hypothetical protein